MRILVTGASGFVAPFLRDELTRHGNDVSLTDIRGEVDFPMDLVDEAAVDAHFHAYRYDAVVHLAGFSSVARSWQMPKRVMELNVFPLLHLMKAISATAPGTRLLVIGSADQYGRVPADTVYLRETQPCQPRSPYAISKYAQEGLALALGLGQKLDVVLTRSFNHIGPGQEKGFVTSDFASAIAQAVHGGPPVVSVGATDVYRDFTDVRDVARAYRLLLQHGRAGEVYNVGSGRLYAIGDILQTLIDLSGVNIQVRKDPAKVRPVDVERVGCCPEKIRTDTGWTSEIPMEQSLQDVLQWWISRTA